MENIQSFLGNIWIVRILSSIIVIGISIILYKILSYIIEKGSQVEKVRGSSNKRKRTFLKLIKSIIRYIFIALTILVILQIFDINVSSIIAGVGVLGVVFGLAIQDWLKDIIRGSSILSDTYFSVGDVVKYNGIEGKVLVIGLKTTKIQDLKTSNIISIANRKIEEIEVVSNLIYINIPMPYHVPLETAEKAISDITNAIKQNNNVDDCIYKSVNELADSSIKYLIEVKSNPIYKLQVRRDALRSILVELTNNNIEVPFTQIDIHQK